MTDPLAKQATATDIAQAVMSGKVKAAAVIEATLSRIATSEPTVNAFTDVVAERARKRAAEIDAALRSTRPVFATGRDHDGLLLPVDGIATSSLVDTYGASRSGGRSHGAIDIMAPRGSRVIAAADGVVQASLPLAIAGLISTASADTVCRQLEHVNAAARSLGCLLSAPFGALSFLALPVIPELRITDQGLFDVVRQEFVQL